LGVNTGGEEDWIDPQEGKKLSGHSMQLGVGEGKKGRLTLGWLVGRRVKKWGGLCDKHQPRGDPTASVKLRNPAGGEVSSG